MNPLFTNSRGEDKNRPSNPLNEADKSYHQGYNTFSYDRDHKTTLSYADVTPFEAVECVEADKIPFGSKHHIMTYTLQSRMLDDLYMKKSYYMLDMRSILPINWEKIYREPAVGNDIPNSSVNCFSKTFFSSLVLPIVLIQEDFRSWEYTDELFDGLLKYIFLLEYVFSDGGLPARLGYHFSSLLGITDNDTFEVKTFDELLNQFYLRLSNYSDGISIAWSPSGMSYSIGDFKDFASMLELMRSYPEYCSIRFIPGHDSETTSRLFDIIGSFFSAISPYAYDAIDDFPFNFGRIAAYQLVCAEYFTRDNLDNIYSAQLYRDNMRSLLFSVEFPTFLYNGVSTLYDSLSGYYLNVAVVRLESYFASKLFSEGESIDSCISYLFNLFTIRKSLRYGDYFIGARPEPYSPLDMTAEVRDGSVSAVDITKSILAQRFSNSVARNRRNFSDYLINVTGGYDVPDVTKPRWLASRTSKVTGFEVDNTTSDDQGKVVTVLNSKNSDYIYEVESGSPAIVIGVVSFSMMRNYGESVDRFCFHEDRYDMYNKMFQYDGDQEVEAKELSPFLRGSYAYQIRNSEYKQRFPIVSGAWKSFLPAMFLISDQSFDIEYKDDYVYNINDFNIRSLNSEFDLFYSSLTNLGLASRFHFMVKFENYCKPKRRMSRTPSIL